MIRITNTVKHLVIINVIVFIVTEALKSKGINLYNVLSMHFPKSYLFQPWQLITHMFMHANLQHILFNMLGLWMFGISIEQMWGRNKFLFFYFSAGLGASLFTLGIDYIDFYNNLGPSLNELGFSNELMDKIGRLDISGSKYRFSPEVLANELNAILTNGEIEAINAKNAFNSLFEFNVLSNSSMLGASGAIMGILVAFGMMFPNSELMMIFLPIPIKAKYFIPAIIGLDIFSGLTGVTVFSPSNTAYWAHIGGALVGFIMMMYWKKTQFNDKRWN